MGSKYPVLPPNDVIIPIHDEIAKGTLKSILQQADMSLETFLYNK